MLPSYIDVASRMYRVLFVVEYVMRASLEQEASVEFQTTSVTTMAEAAAVLRPYLESLGPSKAFGHATSDAADPQTGSGVSKEADKQSRIDKLRRVLKSMEDPNQSYALPPPTTAVCLLGRPLDFVYLSFLTDALSIRYPDRHSYVARDLEALIAYRNAIMHFHDVGPDALDHACTLASRVCQALGKDKQKRDTWIGQWFGRTADSKALWQRILDSAPDKTNNSCVDYEDLAVPPLGRFRPFPMVNRGRVLFPGGLYRKQDSWIRLEPAWVEQVPVAGRSAAGDRLIDSNAYECWIVPEVKAARIEGGEAIGPSGLRFRLGSVERIGPNPTRTGFTVSAVHDRPALAVTRFPSEGDLDRRVSRVTPKSLVAL